MGKLQNQENKLQEKTASSVIKLETHLKTNLTVYRKESANSKNKIQRARCNKKKLTDTQNKINAT